MTAEEDGAIHRSDRIVIRTIEITTPLGTMLAGATEDGICLLEFIGSRRSKRQLEKVQKLLRAETRAGENSHLHDLSVQLHEYFSGTRRSFDLRLILVGTEFQRSVWEGLRTVPYGETISYQEEAKRIGRPTAVRAVARVNGANPISIVIPCHRVIGKDGGLVGYGGGLRRKEELLALEKRPGLNAGAR